MHSLNLVDFNVVTDGRTDNKAAIAAAVAKAKEIAATTGRRVTIACPAGILRVVVGLQGEEHSLLVDADIIWDGEGPGVTDFRFSPNTQIWPADHWFSGFWCAAGTNVEFRNLSVTTTHSVKGALAWPDGTGNRGMLHAICHGGGGSLVVENCSFNGPNGGWSNCVQSDASGGDSVIRLTNNTFNAWGVPVAVWTHDGSRNVRKEVYGLKNRFHSVYNDPSYYMHPSVSGSFIGEYHGPSPEYPNACSRNTYYWNGTDPTQTQAAKFQQIEGAEIVNERTYAVKTREAHELADTESLVVALTNSPQPQSAVAADGVLAGKTIAARKLWFRTDPVAGGYATGSHFVAHCKDATGKDIDIAFTLKGDGGNDELSDELITQFIDASYDPQPGAGAVHLGTDSGLPCTTQISDCKLLSAGGLLDAQNPFVISSCNLSNCRSGVLLTASTSHFRNAICNSRFECWGNSIEAGGTDDHGSIWNISNSDFIRHGASDGGVIDVWINNSSWPNMTLNFSNCSFTGYDGATLGMCNQNLHFADCSFNNGNDAGFTAGIGTYVSPARTAEVTFDNCRKDAGFLLYNVSSLPNDASFVVRGANNYFPDQSFGGIADGVRGYLQLMPGISPDVLASTADLCIPNWLHDAFHVSGAATINNMWIVTDSPTYVCAAKLRVFCDGPIAFSKSGNIKPKTLDPRPLKAEIAFVYDPTDRSWHEL